jgi:hypothetical protein
VGDVPIREYGKKDLESALRGLSLRSDRQFHRLIDRGAMAAREKAGADPGGGHQRGIHLAPGNPGGIPPLNAPIRRLSFPPEKLFIIFCISMKLFMSLLTS